MEALVGTHEGEVIRVDILYGEISTDMPVYDTSLYLLNNFCTQGVEKGRKFGDISRKALKRTCIRESFDR